MNFDPSVNESSAASTTAGMVFLSHGSSKKDSLTPDGAPG